MSDTASIAQSLVTSQAASTRQTLQSTFVRQQAEAEQVMADMLLQSADQAKAALPAGQGRQVDISA